MGESLHIRHIEQHELADAYRVVRQLRPHLDEGAFIERVVAQRRSGYELVGAYERDRSSDRAVIGVIGFRPVLTLARGAYLHVDDLVVDESWRGARVGTELMGFAETYARRCGMESVFLDARTAAIGFYEARGYGFHPSPSMTKSV